MTKVKKQRIQCSKLANIILTTSSPRNFLCNKATYNYNILNATGRSLLKQMPPTFILSSIRQVAKLVNIPFLQFPNLRDLLDTALSILLVVIHYQLAEIDCFKD